MSGAGEHHVREGTILAAGCVLWRRARDGGNGNGNGYDVEVCLVHRPRWDDWSHPKGKLKRGEEPLAAAVREVLEETGHHCAPGVRLPTARYLVDGRPKEVAYWAAEATGGAFEANDEVDRLLWLTPEAARVRLTQPRDREQLTALLDVLPGA
ncbi:MULTISPECIES: NUDIX hydrolase [Streptomyces]|uniref:NUDIX hydrolase n=1 Tax=Streptomyces TaxID=1883 RepID=UPI000823EB24|nr:NUDIX hydrolase [Streptomyces sp. ScaeMP-e48]WSS35165.1 NUDIX hydrolase [Streptomyces microflavus]WST16268.1 NUDIX hydrolase [Streptomyces microflavus]SCK52907.1 8-oxo-dGTP diphosphatase [Streptomyces sp. ScaeMP-e48]